MARPVGRREDPLHAGDGLVQRRVAVAPVEGLGGRERDVDAVERGRREPLPAALVEHEPGQLDARARLDRGDDLLRPGHRRHRVVADEADRLDPAQPGRGEAVHELRAHRRREHDRLVLEPVARADVAEQDVGQRWVTRSGVIRTITRCSPSRSG